MKSLHEHRKPQVEDDLNLLQKGGNDREIGAAISRISSKMDDYSKSLKKTRDVAAEKDTLKAMNHLIRKAWSVVNVGYDFGAKVSERFLKNGVLDYLLKHIKSEDSDLQFESARLLEQVLIAKNNEYVLERDLPTTVKVACEFAQDADVEKSRTGMGILAHIFETTEDACTKLIERGALSAVLNCCRTSDLEILRHCAVALSNLSLYGGPANQEAMVQYKVPEWLFTLAFNPDDLVKYYACLAISVLVANKEIGRAVFRWDILYLVQQFVTTHKPGKFAFASIANIHGQSSHWLEKLIPCLDSEREEAKSLAAFHFAMEAHIKKGQGDTSMFHDIGAVKSLQKVAAAPNAEAAEFSREALELIDEDVPHKLSAQVPIWTVEDVVEWLKQIGFSSYAEGFLQNKVDGDILLQVTDRDLQYDIGIKNGQLRKRFLRELNTLKTKADYSSSDVTGLSEVLHNMGPELCRYTYGMLLSDITVDDIKDLTSEQLEESGVSNSIHRRKIIKAARLLAPHSKEGSREMEQRRWDIFLSYRRSGGSQLASLLKVYLQLRGYTVFLDVKNLMDGKFDQELIRIIHESEHFLLILNHKALDRCMGDYALKDWLHVEIVVGMQAGCHIIPILHNFEWPEKELLPEDMQEIGSYNAISWVHEYQDECVDKIVRFMEDDKNQRISAANDKKHKQGTANKDVETAIQKIKTAQKATDSAQKDAETAQKDAETAQKDTETAQKETDPAQIETETAEQNTSPGTP